MAAIDNFWFYHLIGLLKEGKQFRVVTNTGEAYTAKDFTLNQGLGLVVNYQNEPQTIIPFMSIDHVTNIQKGSGPSETGLDLDRGSI